MYNTIIISNTGRCFVFESDCESLARQLTELVTSEASRALIGWWIVWQVYHRAVASTLFLITWKLTLFILNNRGIFDYGCNFFFSEEKKLQVRVWEPGLNHLPAWRYYYNFTCNILHFISSLICAMLNLIASFHYNLGSFFFLSPKAKTQTFLHDWQACFNFLCDFSLPVYN